jgi:hypothetical protein
VVLKVKLRITLQRRQNVAHVIWAEVVSLADYSITPQPALQSLAAAPHVTMVQTHWVKQVHPPIMEPQPHVMHAMEQQMGIPLLQALYSPMLV